MPEKDEPTQTTPKGLEIPVPKREDFIANLKKTAPKVDAPESEDPGDADS
jgi:hypothetical protein